MALEAICGFDFERPVPKLKFCCHHIPKDDAAGDKLGLVLALITQEARGQQTSSSTIATSQTAAGFSVAFCWF